MRCAATICSVVCSVATFFPARRVTRTHAWTSRWPTPGLRVHGEQPEVGLAGLQALGSFDRLVELHGGRAYDAPACDRDQRTLANPARRATSASMPK